MINHPPRPDMGVRDRTTQQRFLGVTEEKLLSTRSNGRLGFAYSCIYVREGHVYVGMYSTRC